MTTYVLDTSVLLSDPKACERFEGNTIVVPLVVIKELEGKRHDMELGYFARKALRYFEDLREDYDGLTGQIVLDNGSTLIIETKKYLEELPEGLRDGSHDADILSIASHHNATLVSKDMPMRILASVADLPAETYRSQIRIEEEWTGMQTFEVSYEQITDVFACEEVTLPEAEATPVNTGLLLKCGTSSALAVHLGKGLVKQIDGESEVFGVAGKSAEQRIAIDHLTATDVGIVSIGGRAGTGKSAISLLAGLDAVLEEQKYKKIVVFRPMYAVGGQELGFLPGDQNEKMNPWVQAVYDTLEPLVSDNVMDEIEAQGLIEVLPLTHIRGRSLHNAFVIIDEAQSLERNVLLTALSRIGQGSKVVLTHDIAQRDNLLVGRYDGIVSVIDALRNQPLFAHITLKKSERSQIADLVTRLLDF